MDTKEFFSGSAFAGLAAAASFVWVIVNGIRVFLGFHRKWVALVVSFMIVAANAWIAREAIGVQQLLLIVGNTFLLALTSIGLNETVARGAEQPKADQFARPRQDFISSWF